MKRIIKMVYGYALIIASLVSFLGMLITNDVLNWIAILLTATILFTGMRMVGETYFDYFD